MQRSKSLHSGAAHLIRTSVEISRRQ
jgi:hypothetical protein